jgi:hypothetical protein
VTFDLDDFHDDMAEWCDMDTAFAPVVNSIIASVTVLLLCVFGAAAFIVYLIWRLI